jgi:4a-hydroxytetrahydrobiopterin dehydratase
MELSERKCVPCNAGTPPLKSEQVQEYLKKLGMWVLKDNHIEKEFRFENYLDGLNFVNRVGQLAEHEGHHPEIFLGYKKVKLSLKTHAINGLSENDFILASKIEELVSNSPKY